MQKYAKNKSTSQSWRANMRYSNFHNEGKEKERGRKYYLKKKMTRSLDLALCMGTTVAIIADTRTYHGVIFCIESCDYTKSCWNYSSMSDPHSRYNHVVHNPIKNTIEHLRLFLDHPPVIKYELKFGVAKLILLKEDRIPILLGIVIYGKIRKSKRDKEIDISPLEKDLLVMWIRGVHQDGMEVRLHATILRNDSFISGKVAI